MQTSLELELTKPRIGMLVAFAVAVILLIPVPDYTQLAWIPGIIAWVVCLVMLTRDSEAALKRRMSVLLGCVAVLAVCDVNTSLENANFLQVGIPFTIAILVPPLLLNWLGDKDVIRYRFLPVHWRKVDIIYTVLSVPLAWAILKFYAWGNLTFFDHELFRNWTLPAGDGDPEAIKRLFIGINMVGIWDELFFVNTVFGILRSLFKFRIANTLQAVLYTSLLFDMAFTGCGIFIVFFFAWTQGAMFEKSEGLLWVLIVHLVVDFILVAMIVQTYYPDYGYDYLWRHGL